LHSDDLGAPFLEQLQMDPARIAYIDGTTTQTPWLMSEQVLEFRRTLASDIWPDADILDTAEDVSAWALEHGLDHIFTPHAPVGPVRSLLKRVRKAGGAPHTEVRREIDSTAWPLATAGFFKFRKNIPDLLDQFTR